MRDHTKLRAFQMADQLALAVYKHTRSFPETERYGLTSQMRRASVSVASNIVEGSARTSTREYLRFMEMAYASARELHYQLTLARRLEYGSSTTGVELESQASGTAGCLARLIQSLGDDPPAARSPQPPFPESE